jgi:hypothetical protein
MRTANRPTLYDGGLPLPGGYPTLAQEFATAVPATTPAGTDVLLNDVISFEIQVFDPVNGAWISVPFSPPIYGNPLFAQTSPLRTRVFDTWSSVEDDVYNYRWRQHPTDPNRKIIAWEQYAQDPQASTPQPIPGSAKTIPVKASIPAIKVMLRVWDKKTQRTRQVTVIQDM